MKLATYRDGSRDGQLLVVSRDLSQAHYANGIATRLQQVLDDWNFLSPQLEELYITLNQGKARHAFAFDPRQCMAPLPRAYAWVDGAAYPGLTAPPGGAGPSGPGREPMMRRGASDEFLGPCEPARFASEAMGIDFGAGIAVITGDVARGASPEQALEGVRLLALVNDWCLRHLAPPADPARPGPDGLASRPATAFGPVAVTPDELGDAWQGGRVQLSLQSQWNGRKVGHCETGPEMGWHFGQLIAHLTRTRALRAGAIVGAGTVSHADRGRGYACIADKRALEVLEAGEARTEFMKFGDSIRIEMKGPDGQSLFGAIDQDVMPLHEPAAGAA